MELSRGQLNREHHDDQPKLTMLPFFIKALVKTLRIYPEMGSCFDDEVEMVYQYGAAHIAIATQTQNGFVVPMVKHAETLGLWQSADEIKRLSTIARAGNASRSAAPQSPYPAWGYHYAGDQLARGRYSWRQQSS